MTLKKTSLKLTALFAATLLAFSAQAKIITDLDGNQVEIADRVERVADLWHANNQIVLLLGGADKLVATTTTIATNPWYAEVYPNIKRTGVNQR